MSSCSELADDESSGVDKPKHHFFPDFSIEDGDVDGEIDGNDAGKAGNGGSSSSSSRLECPAAFSSTSFVVVFGVISTVLFGSVHCVLCR